MSSHSTINFFFCFLIFYLEIPLVKRNIIQSTFERNIDRCCADTGVFIWRKPAHSHVHSNFNYVLLLYHNIEHFVNS